MSSVNSLGAVFFYWAVVLAVVLELRREMGHSRRGERERADRLTVVLRVMLGISVVLAVALTVVRFVEQS